jgi:hypothetical protein
VLFDSIFFLFCFFGKWVCVSSVDNWKVEDFQNRKVWKKNSWVQIWFFPLLLIYYYYYFSFLFIFTILLFWCWNMENNV